MGYFPAQIGADDESIALHLAKMLGQHLLRCLRKESSQLAKPHRAFVKSAEDANFPFSLNQCQRRSDRGLFLGGKLAAFRNCMVCGLQRTETA